MGKGHCGQHLSAGCAQALHGRGRSLGHARGPGRGHAHGGERGRAGNLGRGRGVLAAWGLLRDVVAGDYLAITLKVHAASKHQAGFYFALQLITDGFVGVFEQIDYLLEVAPEVGAYGYFENLVALGRDTKVAIRLAFGQRHAIEPDLVAQKTHRQTDVVGVVDTKAQDKLLLEQFGLNHINFKQAHRWVLQVIADETGAASKTQQQAKAQQRAKNFSGEGLAKHSLLQSMAQCNKRLLGRNLLFR
jgi:hypothetical protein